MVTLEAHIKEKESFFYTIVNKIAYSDGIILSRHTLNFSSYMFGQTCCEVFKYLFNNF